MSDTRILDVRFPVKTISRLSQREKGTKFGLASSLHLWPGRRPQVAARAAIVAALTPASKAGTPDSKKGALIPNGQSKVFDPFGGGGGFALEAVKLGCSVVTNDLHPVAHLLQRATVEFPHRFGLPLADMVAHWGERILTRTRASLPNIYGPLEEEIIPVAFWWCWGMYCPSCRCWIPFLRNRLLLHHEQSKATVLDTDISRGQLTFGVRLGTAAEAAGGNFDTTGARCLQCGELIPRREIQSRAQAGEMSQRLMGGCERRHGQIVGRAGLPGEQKRALDLQRKIKACFAGIPGGVPTELVRCDSDHVRTSIYGLRHFGDLFLPRQLLVLGTLVSQTRAAITEMQTEGMPAKTAQAVSLYLALTISRTSERNSQLCMWQPKIASISSALARYTLSFCPDFAEGNILGKGSGSYSVALGKVVHTVKTLASNLAGSKGSVRCTCEDAALGKPGKFDIIITDVPYYDSIAYGNLADYFQIWLGRSLRGLKLGWEGMLANWQAGRKGELLVDYRRDGGKQRSVKRLHVSTDLVMRRMRQALEPDGRLVFVFACSFEEGWAAVGDALRKNGFRVRSVWPVQTESHGRLRTQSSRALSCSLWLCCDVDSGARTSDFSAAVSSFQQRLPEARQQWKNWRLPILDFPWFLLAQSLLEFTTIKMATASREKIHAKDFFAKIRAIIC